LRVRDKKGGKPREHVYCTAGRGEIQEPVSAVFSRRDAARRVSTGEGGARYNYFFRSIR
jgi:hypothetical protein